MRGRPLAKGSSRKHLEDITRYPFQGGEWIVTFDVDRPQYDYKLSVMTVTGDAEHGQTLVCQVLTRDHPSHNAGDEVRVVLDPHGAPYLGLVVPNGAQDDAPRIIGYAESQIVNYHLIAWLKEKDTRKYTVAIWEALLHLQKVGILPAAADYYDPNRPKGEEKGPDYLTGSRFMRKCIKIRYEHDKMLQHVSGWVRFNPTFANPMRPSGQVSKNQNDGYVEIDREKFLQSHILLAESGAMGFNVRWK